MILIFEGCDNVGKTTLINTFLKNSSNEFRNKTVVKHFKNPPICKNQRQYIEMEYNAELYKLICYHNEVNFIYDRFYLGDLVYAPIFRKYKPIKTKFIEDSLNNMDAILIYVYADEKDIKKRFDGKFINKNHIKEILVGYKNVLKKSRIENIIYINTSKLNPKECYDYMMWEIWQ